MAEDDVSLDAFDRLINFHLQVAASHYPASVLDVAQQHVQPHYRTNDGPFWGLAVLFSLHEVEPVGPFVDRVHQMEVDDRKQMLILGQRVVVGLVFHLLSYNLRDDLICSLKCVFEVLSVSIIFAERGVHVDFIAFGWSRLVVTHKGANQGRYFCEVQWIQHSFH